MSRVVYWNGKLIPESEAKVSIYDSALMFGDMIFEMTRSFNKEHFKLREHLERLYAGIKQLRIPMTMTIDEMMKAVKMTSDANQLNEDDEHRMMINVTRGLLSIYNGNIEGVEGGTNVIISDFPLRWTVSSMGHLFDTGINAVVPSQRAIPARLLDPKIKNRSRIHYQVANIEVAQFSGKDNWALLLDEDGFVSEGTGDNFFIIKNKTIISPEGRNILRGISREYVKQLCFDYGIKYLEKNIEPYDVYTADEAFMTATPFCILPVTRFNGQPIGDGKPGYQTEELLRLWSFVVGVDIKKQIQSWSEARKVDLPSPYQFK